MQPTMAEYEWTIDQIKVDLLCCTEISFIKSSFNLENLGVKPGFPFFFITLYIHIIL